MKWFRFYSEFRADTKIKRLPIAHRYAFVILLCLANESEDRGFITQLDDEDIAFELEMELEDWQTLKSKFRVKGFIELIENGIKITNWDKRQFASDSSAERVRKHRAKKKERDCNVTTQLLKRYVTPSDTDPDPDSDSDPSLPNPLPQEKECDASLELAQEEESHSSVQEKEQDPERSGSASLDSSQHEAIAGEEPIATVPPLDAVKILLNRLRCDHVPGYMAQEWRMAGALPWRDRRTGDIPEEFAIAVGKPLMFRGDRESMSALEKGRRFVRNSELTVRGMQAVIDAWQEFERKKQEKRVIPLPIERKPEESSPMPEGWLEDIKARRFSNAG